MITRPWRWARMLSHTAFVQITAPIRWTSTTSRKSSRVILAKLLSRRMPALLTRMSTRPHLLRVCSTIAPIATSSVTEAAIASASPPAPSDFRGNFVGSVLGKVVDDDPRSVSREKKGMLAAEPATRAGNDRNPPRQ